MAPFLPPPHLPLRHSALSTLRLCRGRQLIVLLRFFQFENYDLRKKSVNLNLYSLSGSSIVCESVWLPRMSFSALCVCVYEKNSDSECTVSECV